MKHLSTQLIAGAILKVLIIIVELLVLSCLVAYQFFKRLQNKPAKHYIPHKIKSDECATI